MANANSRSPNAPSDTHRLMELKARAKARGYELITDDSMEPDKYFALGIEDRVMAYKPMTLADIAEWLDTADRDDAEAAARAADKRATDAATGKVDGLDAAGIRAQARRVCSAYRDLVSRTNAETDFSDEAFGDLIGQIKRLEGWLEPAKEQPADDDALRAASEPYSDVSLLLGECKAIADLVQIATERDPALLDDTVTTTAAMMVNKITEAEERLNAVWVAIGGKSAPEHVRPEANRGG